MKAKKNPVHYFGGLYPLRGACGQPAVEVVVTHDLRQITCPRCRTLRRRELAQLTATPPPTATAAADGAGAGAGGKE